MDKKHSSNSHMLSAIFITSLILFWVLLGFGGGFVVSLIFTYIYYKVVQKKPELRKYWKKLSFVFVALALVIGLSSATQEDAQMRETNEEIVSGQSDTHTYVTTDPESYERKVELLTLETLGADTVINLIDIINSELTIDYVASDNLTDSLVRRGIIMDAAELMEKLAPTVPSEITTVNFNSSLKLVDEYGNTSLDKVGLISFNRDTWEKINWENFITDNVATVADYFWIHPTLNS